jgi:hypothetical protein
VTGTTGPPTVTTRSERIEQFTVKKDAPEGALCALLCEDHVGRYTIPFPCRYFGGEWLNARAGELIDAEIIGWREWRVNG